MTATVLTVASHALLDACAALGLDGDAILAAVGLSRADIADPDMRIPVDTMSALWREVHARSSDPDLALHVAEALPFGAYTVIDFLARTGGSIGTLLERIARYFPLINSAIELRIAAGGPLGTDARALAGDHVRLDVIDRRGPGRLPRSYAEYTLAAIVVRTRSAAGVAWPLLRVDFAYDAPASCREHERIFGCPVRFSAEQTGLAIARGTWDTQLPRADTGLAAVLERHAEMLMAQLPRVSDDIARIRTAIREQLEGGDASLDAVAKKLATSRRSLQRRLADESLTFAAVLDDVRSTMARAYLGQRGRLSIAEVAYLLGFSEQSSFTRAFRRWTGVSPAEFRRSST